jgi:hypothetical protein
LDNTQPLHQTSDRFIKNQHGVGIPSNVIKQASLDQREACNLLNFQKISREDAMLSTAAKATSSNDSDEHQ